VIALRVPWETDASDCLGFAGQQAPAIVFRVPQATGQGLGGGVLIRSVTSHIIS